MKKTIETKKAKVSFWGLHFSQATKDSIFADLSIKIEIGGQEYNTSVRCRSTNIPEASNLMFVPILDLNAHTYRAIYERITPEVINVMKDAFAFAEKNRNLTEIEKCFDLDTEETQDFLKSLMLQDLSFHNRLTYLVDDIDAESLPWNLEVYMLCAYKSLFRFDEEGKNIPEKDWTFILSAGNEEEDIMTLDFGRLEDDFNNWDYKGSGSISSKLIKDFIESVIPLQEMIKQDISVPAPFIIQW